MQSSTRDYSINYKDMYGNERTMYFNDPKAALAFIDYTPNWIEANFDPERLRRELNKEDSGNVKE